MVLDKPDVIKPHFIGQDALLDGFVDDRMVIQRRPLHFIGETQFHEIPPGGRAAPLGGCELTVRSSYPKTAARDSGDCLGVHLYRYSRIAASRSGVRRQLKSGALTPIREFRFS